MKSTSDTNSLIERTLRVVVLGVIGLMPVHAVLSVGLTALFGNQQLWQSWKEMLIASSCIVAVWLIVHNKHIRDELAGRMVNRAIAVYVLLHLVLIVAARPPLEAALVGLALNMRFLLLFVLAQILVLLSAKPKLLRRQAVSLTLWGAIIVGTFGFLQATVLPDDVLVNIGYGTETIEPFRTIDQNSDFVRINSTTRGPSPLGLYLVVVSAIIASIWLRTTWVQPIQNWPRLFALSIGVVVTLWASYTRSGWLAAVIALGVVITLLAKKNIVQKRFVMGCIAVVLVASSVLALNWQSDFVQITVLHRDPQQGVSIDSDDVRAEAMSRAVDDIAQNPIGDGPGTAGPASFYTDEPRIAENYYLQIAQEVGIAGAVLFMGISGLAVSSLWPRRKEPMGAALLASFIGLGVANLFVHGWAQDEVALIWWGLAGLYVNSD